MTTNLSTHRNFIASALIAVFLAALTAGCASQNSAQVKSAEADRLITDIVSREDAAGLSVTVKGSEQLAYTAVKQDAPLGVLFHFPGTGLDNLKQVYYPPENDTISSIRASEFYENGRTSSIFISLKSDVAYELSPEGADLKIVFPKSGAPAAKIGGPEAAERMLHAFLDERLARYGDSRNDPDVDATSGLSPYLHFGHVSVHQVFAETMRRAGWSPQRVSAKATGSSHDWWGVDAAVESFLDELITWRELGYNMCSRTADYDSYDSLPAWARQTLAKHADDPRAHVYTLDEFESAATHDPLWNAAQRQLVREGRIHNYLRMLWGKKILEWSSSPQAALETLIELNNKYALDGRNPNSYSGIFWLLGRYDRAWGPERPVFGTIRYMSSENTARKVRVKEYLRRYGPG